MLAFGVNTMSQTNACTVLYFQHCPTWDSALHTSLLQLVNYKLSETLSHYGILKVSVKAHASSPSPFPLIQLNIEYMCTNMCSNKNTRFKSFCHSHLHYLMCIYSLWVIVLQSSLNDVPAGSKSQTRYGVEVILSLASYFTVPVIFTFTFLLALHLKAVVAVSWQLTGFKL